MILIVSNPEDAHAKHIATLLEQKGHRALILCKADFGTSCALTLDPLAERGTIRLARISQAG